MEVFYSSFHIHTHTHTLVQLQLLQKTQKITRYQLLVGHPHIYHLSLVAFLQFSSVTFLCYDAQFPNHYDSFIAFLSYKELQQQSAITDLGVEDTTSTVQPGSL